MSKPVLVIGAGPVGLTMAVELARYGVPVRIVDKLPTRTMQSRALAIWPRTLELLQAAGYVEAFIANGLHAKALGIYWGNKPLARIPFKTISSCFKYVLMLPQSETERLLEEYLKTLGGTVERETELTDFVDKKDGVFCTLTHKEGESETLEAAWLIGCDGAHSFVRSQLGLAFEGNTFPVSFVLADVHVSGLSTPSDEPAIFWHHDGAVMIFPISEGRYRVIADLGLAPLHMPNLEEMQAIIDQRGPGGITLSDPVWLSDFGVNERKVREYRRGRVFLAGDAAHIHSPAGGQGMNMGMQDAFNLAWKLALLEQKKVKPFLLDSYSIERSAVARQIFSDSRRMTKVVLLKNRQLQRVRNFIVKVIFSIPMARHKIANRLAGITISYPDSPLNAGVTRGRCGPRPGQRLIVRHDSQDSHVPHFSLMARDDAKAQNMILRYPYLLKSEICSPSRKNGIWLVRPDGYVAATARDGEWTVIEEFLSNIVVEHDC